MIVFFQILKIWSFKINKNKNKIFVDVSATVFYYFQILFKQSNINLIESLTYTLKLNLKKFSHFNQKKSILLKIKLKFKIKYERFKIYNERFVCKNFKFERQNFGN